MNNVQCRNADFLQIQPLLKYKNIKFILLDPSCSGSGMLTNFIRDANYNAHHNT